MTPSRPTRRGLMALTASLAAVIGVAQPAAADHGGGPSAGQVAAGQAVVSEREQQVAAAAAALARARAKAERLGAAAEVAVEAYDAARVRRQSALRDVRVARLVLDDATSHVKAARARVEKFAASAYMSGGLSSIDAMLSADGPAALLSRVGTLEVISNSQRDAVQTLDAARVYQLAVQQQAQSALRRADSAARDAASARAAAQSAVHTQTAVLADIHQRQTQLRELLSQARRHVSALEQARLAAIARAKAAAAARAAAAAARAAAAAAAAAHPAPPPAPVPAPQPPPAGGDIGGTVSASTEASAVHYAESQIGKPYQWGAAGPDSYDCSGLVMWAYAQVGVSLDHYTGYQWNEGAHIPTSALRPGDLVFFATNTSDPNTIHHVGMYIGNGEMVEAPYTGADVRISSAFRPDLIGAVRPYNR